VRRCGLGGRARPSASPTRLARVRCAVRVAVMVASHRDYRARAHYRGQHPHAPEAEQAQPAAAGLGRAR